MNSRRTFILRAARYTSVLSSVGLFSYFSPFSNKHFSLKSHMPAVQDFVNSFLPESMTRNLTAATSCLYTETSLPASVTTLIPRIEREGLELKTYLFASLSEQKLSCSDRGKILNGLRGKTYIANIPQDFRITIYFSQSEPHGTIANKLATKLSRMGIPSSTVGLDETQFWTSWTDREGVFLMDWVTLPSSDHVVAAKTLLPTSRFQLKHAPRVSPEADLEKVLVEFNSFALRVT